MLCLLNPSIHCPSPFVLCRAPRGRSPSQLTQVTAWTSCQFITELTHKDQQIHTLRVITTDLKSLMNTTCVNLDCGRKLQTWREPTETREERANSTQKGPDWEPTPGDLLAVRRHSSPPPCYNSSLFAVLLSESNTINKTDGGYPL